MAYENICSVRTERRETVVGILHALDGPEFNFHLAELAEHLGKNRRYLVTVGYCDDDHDAEEGSYVMQRVVIV